MVLGDGRGDRRSDRRLSDHAGRADHPERQRPLTPLDQVRGVRWATIDEFGHFGVASQARDGTRLDLDVRDRRSGADADSDTALCLAGYITLTLLAPVTAEPAPDIDPGEVVPLGRGGGHS